MQKQTARAVKWSFVSSAGGQGLRLISSVVLARLLSPADFGVIGMATLPLGFFRLLGESGTYNALVGGEEVEGSRASSALLVSLGLALAFALLTVVLAPTLTAFFGEPKLLPILMWSSLVLPIGACRIVPRAVLAKRLAFRELMIAEVSGFALGGGIGVLLAYWGHGPMALISQAIVTEVVSLLVTVHYARWIPREAPSRAALAQIVRRASGITGFDVINYWARNADNLVVGKTLGSDALGLYTRAYFLMTLPLNQVVVRIGSVMVPALARLYGDKERTREAYLRAIDGVTLLGFPAALGMWCCAEPLVLVLYGPKWLGVVPILRILALVTAIQVVMSPGGWLYISQQKTKEYFIWGGFCAAFLVAVILVGGYFGTVRAIALAYLLGNLVLVGPAVALPMSFVGGGLRDVLRRVMPQAVCAVLMVAAASGAGWVTHGMLPALRLGIMSAVGALVYVGVYVWWRPLAFRALVDLLRGR